MSGEVPPPLSAPAPLVPQPVPQVSMAPRWIAWSLTSVLMPALPWFTTSTDDKEPIGLMIMTGLALVCQLAVTIYLALGFSRKNRYGPGGVIGMTTVFMIASVAIGTAVWLLGFMVVIMMAFDGVHH